jgi:hypothetical protein
VSNVTLQILDNRCTVCYSDNNNEGNNVRTITFTATVTVRDDCEDMTAEELLAFAKWKLEEGAVVYVDDIGESEE